jgi:hypothetical protein
MVQCNGVGDQFENRRLTGARRCNNETAGAFADGGNEVDDSSFELFRCGLQSEFLDRIDRYKILKRDALMNSSKAIR